MFVYKHFPSIAPIPIVFTEFLEDSFEREMSAEHILNELGEHILRHQRQTTDCSMEEPLEFHSVANDGCAYLHSKDNLLPVRSQPISTHSRVLISLVA